MAGTKLYTVHEKGGVEGEVEFVREGFSIWAFLFSFLWLWAHRAWLAGFAVLGLFLLLGFGQTALGVPEYLHIAIQVVIGIGAGIFGRDCYRAALTRRGFVETGVATGESIDEAEIRYFGKRLNQLAAAPPAAVPEAGLHSAAPAIPA
ncbi:DUF2628 domain-containing protein [Emcibacter sp. SYSU 3D8]|uniref:DUF2628 domain-containing protein n=1 Tax=Emcibacter sp. SYSU 3D8 TaxID=3133969 RepID=UPI0031FF43ED